MRYFRCTNKIFLLLFKKKITSLRNETWLLPLTLPVSSPCFYFFPWAYQLNFVFLIPLPCFMLLLYLCLYKHTFTICIFQNRNNQNTEMNSIYNVQLPSHIWLLRCPWTAACQASLSLTISQSLPKFMSIASVMPSSHLILWRPHTYSKT